MTISTNEFIEAAYQLTDAEIEMLIREQIDRLNAAANFISERCQLEISIQQQTYGGER